MFKYTTWKPVVGYEKSYMVSDCGKVLSLRGRRRKELKPLSVRGYHRVNLYLEGVARQLSVHRLVLEAHAGECPEGYQCAHKDGIKIHNSLGNLMWATAKENSSHRVSHGTLAQGSSQGSSKLTESDIPVIRGRLASGEPQRSIAADYGVAQSQIGNINTGKRWSQVQ